MNMVGHYGEGMTNVMTEGVRVVMDGFDDHVRDCWLAKVERTAAGFVQQSVQCDKRPSGGGCGCWEGSIRRQTAVEAPREEYGPVQFIEMGKTPPVRRHAGIVSQTMRNSQERTSRPGGRLRTGGPPYLNDGAALDVKFRAC